MPLERKPFRSYNLDNEGKPYDTFTVRLNPGERERLNWAKRQLRQEKDSTAIKTLADLGYFVLQDSLTGKIIKTIFENKRKNKRSGVGDPGP